MYICRNNHLKNLVMKKLFVVLVILFVSFGGFSQFVVANPDLNRNPLASSTNHFNLSDSVEFEGFDCDCLIDSLIVVINKRFNSDIIGRYSFEVYNFFKTENGFDFDIIVTDTIFYTPENFFNPNKPKYTYFITTLSNIEVSFMRNTLITDIEEVFTYLND